MVIRDPPDCECVPKRFKPRLKHVRGAELLCNDAYGRPSLRTYAAYIGAGADKRVNQSFIIDAIAGYYHIHAISWEDT